MVASNNIRNRPSSKYQKWCQYVSGERPWEKDALLDTIHWLRQLISVVAGVACGILGLTGAYPVMTFLAACGGAGFVFYRSFRIDEDDYGGHGALMMEGMGQAFSLFLVLWICIFSTLHT
uniref:Rab5-interacting family protein n=2 Tax=Tetraselmis sp. GSL018 TaxID=582737 RepID=A0A061RYM4_9CHLO